MMTSMPVRSAIASLALAAATAAGAAEIALDAGGATARIDPRLYGQFIEFLGGCIQGGIFEPDSALADTNGFRRDVMEKARELAPPLLRWPGGTYTKIYHWQDGVGARTERRTRPNLIWGGEVDNLFGTDEFIRYCRAVGAEPYISVNMGTGSAEEAANWVEYCNGTGTTYYAQMRRKNGSPEPFRVKFWGLGNEEEAEPDCGRLQDPAAYAKEAWHFAKLMKLQDPSIRLIVAGVGNNTNWNAVVLDSLQPVADYISAHWYLRAKDATGLFGSVANFERQLADWTAFLGRYPAEPKGFSHWYRFPPRQAPVKLAIDEWGLWQGGTSRTNLWGLEQTYTWADALVVASWLNAMHRHAEVIGFATWAQMVNVIAPIRADARGSIRQTVFHPLALYARDCGQLATPLKVDSPLLPGTSVPALDAAATRHEPTGSLVLTVVNRDDTRAIPASLALPGARMLGGTELTADSLTASNALATPDRDCVRRRAIPPRTAAEVYEFPPRSITLLRLATGPANGDERKDAPK